MKLMPALLTVSLFATPALAADTPQQLSEREIAAYPLTMDNFEKALLVAKDLKAHEKAAAVKEWLASTAALKGDDTAALAPKLITAIEEDAAISRLVTSHGLTARDFVYSVYGFDAATRTGALPENVKLVKANAKRVAEIQAGLRASWVRPQ